MEFKECRAIAMHDAQCTSTTVSMSESITNQKFTEDRMRDQTNSNNVLLPLDGYKILRNYISCLYDDHFAQTFDPGVSQYFSFLVNLLNTNAFLDETSAPCIYHLFVRTTSIRVRLYDTMDQLTTV